MYFRSDLALEVCEQASGVNFSTKTEQLGECKITRTEIPDTATAKALGKPIGSYVTFEMPPLSLKTDVFDERVNSIASQLSKMLPKGLCLVVGLGNEDITPDALGPKTASGVLATRHIDEQLKRSAGLEQLNPVAVITPGVLGKTGIESAETVKSIVRRIEPACVIVVDAFAARELSRLGCTVQITDAGISPGSGVGNSRKELSKGSLGVPVISIGVPTVVDAVTLAANILDCDDEGECKKAVGADDMFVTPREIDSLVDTAAKLLSVSINRALQPDFTGEEIELLL